jgi:hypothetical protein
MPEAEKNGTPSDPSQPTISSYFGPAPTAWSRPGLLEKILHLVVEVDKVCVSSPTLFLSSNTNFFFNTLGCPHR